MVIDWPNFTPIGALVGGGLIGLSAALLYLALGRLAGISGIFGGLLERQCDDVYWRIFFLFGLIGAPAIWGLLFIDDVFVARWQPSAPLDWSMICVGGLLVGFGSRLGSGCTSGHGVCGLARFSKRSLVAVACFMGSGMLTVFVSRHLFGV